MMRQSLWIMAVLCLFVPACDSLQPSQSLEAEQAIPLSSTTDLLVGDRAETIAEADVYEPLSVLVGTQPVGAQGTVLTNPKTKNGDTWYRIDFDDGVDGLVNANLIQLVGGDDDPPPPPPPGGYTLGFIGCSKTRDLGKGMDRVALEIIHWPQIDGNGGKVLKGYGGGGLDIWASSGGNKWAAYDRGTTHMPETNIVLFEVCVSSIYTPGSTPGEAEFAMGESVAGIAQAKLPNTEFYAMGTWPYEEGHVCGSMGDEFGPAFAQTIADTLIARGHFLDPDGLDRVPLLATELKDGCHANMTGQDKQALLVRDWINNLPEL